MASVMRPAAPRLAGCAVVAFAAVLLVAWPAADARAQVPDIDDVQVPDPGDLELPEPDEVVPDLDEVVPEPGDVELPVVDEDVPDPGDVEPGNVQPPDSDAPDAGNEPAPGRSSKGGAPPSARRPGSGGGGSAARDSLASTFADLAAVRTGGGSVLPLERLDRNPAAKAGTERTGIAGLIALLTFPVILMVAVGAWLALQDRFDRRDPQLALGRTTRGTPADFWLVANTRSRP